MCLFAGAVKVTIQLVLCTVTPSKTTIAWSKKVSRDYVNSEIKIYFNGQVIEGKWVSCTGLEYDDLWILKHDQVVTDGLNIKVLLFFTLMSFVSFLLSRAAFFDNADDDQLIYRIPYQAYSLGMGFYISTKTKT